MGTQATYKASILLLAFTVLGCIEEKPGPSDADHEGDVDPGDGTEIPDVIDDWPPTDAPPVVCRAKITPIATSTQEEFTDGWLGVPAISAGDVYFTELDGSVWTYRHDEGTLKKLIYEGHGIPDMESPGRIYDLGSGPLSRGIVPISRPAEEGRLFFLAGTYQPDPVGEPDTYLSAVFDVDQSLPDTIINSVFQEGWPCPFGGSYTGFGGLAVSPSGALGFHAEWIDSEDNPGEAYVRQTEVGGSLITVLDGGPMEGTGGADTSIIGSGPPDVQLHDTYTLVASKAVRVGTEVFDSRMIWRIPNGGPAECIATDRTGVTCHHTGVTFDTVERAIGNDATTVASTEQEVAFVTTTDVSTYDYVLHVVSSVSGGSYDVESGTTEDGIDFVYPHFPLYCHSTDELHFVASDPNNDFHPLLVVRRADGTFETVAYELGVDWEGLGDPDLGPWHFGLNSQCQAVIVGDGGWGLRATLPSGEPVYIAQGGDMLPLLAPDSTGALEAEVESLWAAVSSNTHNSMPQSLDEFGRVAFLALLEGREYGIYIAELPEDCPPVTLVNSTADGEDSDLADGRCYTGHVLPSGQPECTLRAAIEQANADTGHDHIVFWIDAYGPHTIQPESALPRITDDVAIDATTQPGGVILDGSLAGSSGLDIASTTEITGLEITGCLDHGIVSSDSSDLTLSRMLIHQNCGWGVSAGGVLAVSDSTIHTNGTGSACDAGGILSTPPTWPFAVRATRTEIRDNGGPGILSFERVVLENSTITGNEGQGVAVAGLSAAVTHALQINAGTTTVSSNLGHGIDIQMGSMDVSSGGSLDVESNDAWGLYVASGRLKHGDYHDLPTTTSRYNNNGHGSECTFWTLSRDTPTATSAPCSGGGLFINNQEPATKSFIPNVVASDNNGPGILSTGPVTIGGGALINRNAGQGIGIVNPGTASSRTSLETWIGDVAIAANQGDGILSDTGVVNIMYTSSITVTDNGSWGIFSTGGTLRLGHETLGSETRSLVSSNGSGTTCYVWHVESGEPARIEETCSGGGIYVDDVTSTDWLFIDNVDITLNAGPGILTDARVKLSRTEISSNEGQGLASYLSTTWPTQVTATLSPIRIADNQGHGIHVESGNIDLPVEVEITLNDAWGILLVSGDILLTDTSCSSKSVTLNGAGTTCYEWTMGTPPTRTDISCASGGISAQDGSVTASCLTVTDNTGTGIQTSSDLTVNTGMICDNTTDLDVGGATSLTGVTTTCP